MDEILKQLLDNELLSESTRTQISEQWQKSVDTFKQTVREEVSADVRAELAESWVTERDQLVTKLDGFLGSALTREISELQEDVNRFRDHEVEQAAKIVEMRQSMATTLAEEMDQLVDKLDQFLEMRLTSEIDELREDIEVARQNTAGLAMFEAFRKTYETDFVDEASIQSKLNIAESKLAEARKANQALKTEREQMVRESKMAEVLSPLSGTAKEQMALILKSVPTAQLSESYSRFVGRVLREGQEPTKQTLAESTTATVIKTGDAAPAEAPAKQSLSESAIADKERLQRLAGIIK